MSTRKPDVYLRLTTSMTSAAAWERIMSRRGLCLQGSLTGKGPGDLFEIESGAGDLFRGMVLEMDPPARLSLEVGSMNGSQLHVHVIPLEDGGCQVDFALVAIGLHHDEIFSFDANWQIQLRDLFGGSKAAFVTPPAELVSR